MPQARLKDLMDLSDRIDVPMFIVEVESEGAFVMRKLNAFHEKTTGMRSADSAGKRLHDSLPPRVADGLADKCRTCVRSRQPFSYEEVLNLPKGELWWQTTLSPVIFDDGRVIGIIGTSVDITDRKAREFRDAQLISQLRELNDQVNMYTSMASHDVRGPLRKILVMTDLIFDGHDRTGDAPLTLDAEGRALVENIAAVAAKTLAHVDDILSQSRALAHQADPVHEPVDLNLLCQDIMGVIDPHSTIAFSHPRATVFAERGVLQVVLRNLLENAVKYCKNACHVALEVAPQDGGDNDALVGALDGGQVVRERIKLVVCDDGPGFTDEAVFNRANTRSATKAEIKTDLKANMKANLKTNMKTDMETAASGVGLGAAQRLIEARGCSLWLVPSHFGEGAGVAFTVPGSLLD